MAGEWLAVAIRLASSQFAERRLEIVEFDCLLVAVGSDEDVGLAPTDLERTPDLVIVGDVGYRTGTGVVDKAA